VLRNELYLLELYRYIELNPVRAGMVEEPSTCSWSSYSINALGVKSDLQTPHPEYLALGQTQNERLNNYRELFKLHIETELLTEIRENINKGLALGNERFITQIEHLTKRRVTARKAKRPKKTIKQQTMPKIIN
jgi:putative transposase